MAFTARLPRSTHLTKKLSRKRFYFSTTTELWHFFQKLCQLRVGTTRYYTELSFSCSCCRSCLGVVSCGCEAELNPVWAWFWVTIQPPCLGWRHLVVFGDVLLQRRSTQRPKDNQERKNSSHSLGTCVRGSSAAYHIPQILRLAHLKERTRNVWVFALVSWVVQGCAKTPVGLLCITLHAF